MKSLRPPRIYSQVTYIHKQPSLSLRGMCRITGYFFLLTVEISFSKWRLLLLLRGSCITFNAVTFNRLKASLIPCDQRNRFLLCEFPWLQLAQLRSPIDLLCKSIKIVKKTFRVTNAVKLFWAICRKHTSVWIKNKIITIIELFCQVNPLLHSPCTSQISSSISYGVIPHWETMAAVVQSSDLAHTCLLLEWHGCIHSIAANCACIRGNSHTNSHWLRSLGVACSDCRSMNLAWRGYTDQCKMRDFGQTFWRFLIHCLMGLNFLMKWAAKGSRKWGHVYSVYRVPLRTACRA